MAHLPRFPVLGFVFLFVGVHVLASHAGPLPPAYDSSMCSSRCGDVEIQYPFYLASATAATVDHRTNFSCGYTDLKLFCRGDDGDESTIIRLGEYDYKIKEIYYNTNTILLADIEALRGSNDDGCSVVPRNVTFDSNWLRYQASSYDNLTFFLHCYPRDDLPPGLDAYRINCPWSGDTPLDGAGLVFSSEQHEVHREHDLEEHCDPVFVVVPVLRGSLSNLSVLPRQYGDVLRNGFELSWNRTTTDQCHLCEDSGGRCAYSQHRLFLGCLCTDGKVGTPNCVSRSSKSLRN